MVFEIASGSTWRTDLEYKIGRYGQLGVREYFAYDPTQVQLWTGVRLRGWRYNFEGQSQVINSNEPGRLWSNQLQLWLVDARPKVRLYRSNGEQVLERAEEEYLARLAAEQREATEHVARVLAEQREAAERTAKEVERDTWQKLLAKLKERGIDPDKL